MAKTTSLTPKPASQLTSLLLIYPTGVPKPEQVASHFQRQLTDPLVSIITDDKSIKIKQIRQLQSNLATAAPTTKQQSYRLVIISPATMLTTASAQALLKLVEDPPTNTQIVLTATATSQLLPTIISRCQIKIVPSDSPTKQPTTKQSTLWEQIQASRSTKELVILTQKLTTDRQAAQQLLNQELLQLQSQPRTKELLTWQKNILAILPALKQNVNVTLCFEKLILSTQLKNTV